MLNPADDARRQSLLVAVGLLLVLGRVWKIYRAAGAARQLERDLRARHARELEDLDAQQMERVAALREELTRLREKHEPEPPPPAEEPAG